MELKEEIDSGRLIRASKVMVLDTDSNGYKMPQYHYRAKGSEGDYYLYTNPHLSCDCPDFTIRGKVCKHLIKALIIEGDPQVLKAVDKFGLGAFVSMNLSR
jgi:hypothetical protein